MPTREPRSDQPAVDPPAQPVEPSPQLVELPPQLVELPPQLVDLLVSALRRWAPSSPTAASQLSTGTCQIATEQQRLVLTYDAFRTALGRPGAASLATFHKDGDRITLAGPIPGGNLQAIG